MEQYLFYRDSWPLLLDIVLQMVQLLDLAPYIDDPVLLEIIHQQYP